MKCQICDLVLKKGEAQFVDESTFSYMSKPPVDSGTFCVTCFESQVASHVDAYNEKLEQAKNVNVFFASQSKESRFIRRTEKSIQVEDCDDRDEAILKLAFRAVELGLNTLVDVDLASEKVKMGGWQTSKWKGKAIPARVDEAKLKRRFPNEPN